jgi:hypothetical protein
MKELNRRFQEYCDHYQFKDNGTGEKNVCITSSEQYRTPLQKECMGDFDAKCIGPLGMLIGRWEGEFGQSFNMVPNYDTHTNGGAVDDTNREFKVLPYGAGRVPQQPLTDLASFELQYKEVLTFEPILGGVKNRGVQNADPINAECQQNQLFQGLVYKLKIVQISKENSNGAPGDVIHEENGMYMYNTIYASGGGTGYEIIKMMVVPHGITVTSPGNHSTFTEADSDSLACDLVSQQQATDMLTAPQPFGVCVPDSTYTPSPAAGNNLPEDLIPSLTNKTENLENLKEFTHLKFEEYSHAASPFVAKQANVKEYKYDMWVSTLVDEEGKEEYVLQYAQNAKFEFMTRLECLDCEGVTSRDEKECITGCAGFESIIYNGTGLINGDGEGILGEPDGADLLYGPIEGPEYAPGYNFNQVIGQLHGQCFSCNQSLSPDRGLKATGVSCADQPLIEWPHLQANTLRKVSSDPNYDWNSLRNPAPGADGAFPNGGSATDSETWDDGQTPVIDDEWDNGSNQTASVEMTEPSMDVKDSSASALALIGSCVLSFAITAFLA